MQQSKVQCEDFKWGAMFNLSIHIYLTSQECFARRLLYFKRLSDVLRGFQVSWHALLCAIKWSFIVLAFVTAALHAYKSIVLMRFSSFLISFIEFLDIFTQFCTEIITGHLGDVSFFSPLSPGKWNCSQKQQVSNLSLVDESGAFCLELIYSSTYMQIPIYIDQYHSDGPISGQWYQ